MADYYKVAAGYTTTGGVAEEGQVVRAEDMVHPGVEFAPLTPEEQMAKWGRVIYEEYTPEEGEVIGSVDAPPYPPGDNPIADPELADSQREAELPGVDIPEKSTSSRSTAASEPVTSTTTPPKTSSTTTTRGTSTSG